jgi:hypothetical protein
MDCLRCSGAYFFCEYSMDSYWVACSFLINSGIVRAWRKKQNSTLVARVRHANGCTSLKLNYLVNNTL